jgi:hypothetical protein
LRASGAGVLLASLAPGALQRAAADILAPVATVQMAPAIAQALIERVRALEDAA